MVQGDQGALGNRFNERASVGCDGLAGVPIRLNMRLAFSIVLGGNT